MFLEQTCYVLAKILITRVGTKIQFSAASNESRSADSNREETLTWKEQYDHVSKVITHYARATNLQNVPIVNTLLSFLFVKE